jgi:Protein metal binding site.
VPDDTGPLDADGDGYPAADDCDDADPSVHPGATERDRTGVDEDCDGYVDLDAGDLSDVGSLWLADGTDEQVLGAAGVTLCGTSTETVSTTWRSVRPWVSGCFRAGTSSTARSTTWPPTRR